MLFFRNSENFFMGALILSFLAIAICSGCSSKDQEVEAPQDEGIDLLSLASVQMAGWEEKETTFISKAKDISKHMGDETELYLAYGLKRLVAKEYRNEESLPILVEIYELDSSENAYGIYSFDTVGVKPEIGQGAAYSHGLLRFWKDRLLVKVLAREEYMEVEKDVLAFGREIDSKILTTGSLPYLLALMPEEKLIPDSLHFFHKNICLNNICYIPESTTLHLSEQTDALTARYDLGGRPPLLLLIDYPNGVAAETAFMEFGALYFQGEPVYPDRRINVVKVGEDEYSSITLTRNFVIVVIDARNVDVCKKLVASALTKIGLYGKSASE